MKGNSFPLERERFIENFTKSICYYYFYIFPKDEPCMAGPSAIKNPIEDFSLSKRLSKRKQDVFFPRFKGFKILFINEYDS